MESMIKEYLWKRGFESPLLLGKGGFGSVYRVRERNTGRLYACKVATGNRRIYLEREAAVLQTLHHPLFPYYKAAWEEGEYGFLCMEYIAGSGLEELVARRGKLAERTVRQIAAELAIGISMLHVQGYIFRDIKPGNILLRQDGRVKLLDFGCICKVGEECCEKAGTVGYGAPEQFVSGKIGSYTDVYALGKVMQYMLFGCKPSELSEKQLSRKWKECVCEKSTRRIVDYCVQKNVENRLPNMEVLIKLLYGKKIQSNYIFVENIWKTAALMPGIF